MDHAYVLWPWVPLRLPEQIVEVLEWYYKRTWKLGKGWTFQSPWWYVRVLSYIIERLCWLLEEINSPSSINLNITFLFLADAEDQKDLMMKYWMLDLGMEISELSQKFMAAHNETSSKLESIENRLKTNSNFPNRVRNML